jgi:hypothetical protein
MEVVNVTHNLLMGIRIMITLTFPLLHLLNFVKRDVLVIEEAEMGSMR